MNLRDLPPSASLRAFAAFAEVGSVTGAGAALGVSHAAISQQLRALEDHLGIALLERRGRGVALTEAGDELATAVTGAFGLIGDAVARITGRGAGRPVQITTTPMFAAHWLMPRLAGFRRRFPDVEIMLNPSPQVVELTPGGVDIAIRHGKGHWPGLDVELLLPAEHVIVAAPELVKGRRIDRPDDLLELPWLQEVGTNEVDEWLAGQGVTEGRARFHSHLPGNFVLEAARRGEGLAATTRVLIEEDIASGSLVVLFNRGTIAEGYHIVTRPGPLRPPAAAFVRWLRAEKSRSG
ncbi:LysR family transcriptional regulator [Vannielia litorea]|uniref:LysR family transcriptional regulator, glycine cleavage system transcriptional activator n=1 Tax=Vannielia litorea TaxID=1217970 RepID=A0A1N6H8P4_9RHOB|nr:LysR family transcriptional regulator [Vannielia litorea]SIO16164.1 LysR family transcriptional regulator, glycine cleavage system transcriptional activator [Vannielia litorea]